MVEVVAALIVTICVMSIFFGFITLMSGLCLESRADIIVGSIMILIPFIAGCIYVGVAS